MKSLLKSTILFYFIILVTETLAQGPPGTFNGSASGTTITLNWTTTASGTDGYFIRAKRNPGGTYPTLPLATATHPLAAEDANLGDAAGIHDVNAQATTSYNGFTGAVAGAQYDFEIYSYDDDGDAQSAAPAVTSVFTLATTPGAYPTPFNFSALGGASSIGLTFTKASRAPMDAHGYVVLRKAGSNPAVTGLSDGPAPAATDFIGVVSDSTFTTFTDNTATPGISYTYALVPYRVGFNGATPIVGTYKYGSISTFSTATVPLVAAIAQQAGGVSNTVIATNTNRALIGFSFTSNGTQTLTGATFTLSSPAATLGLIDFELWESNVATYDGVDGMVVATAGNINVTGAVVTASGFSASTSKYYFLIADVSASAGTTTFNVQFTTAATAGTISTAAPYFSHSGISITALTLALNQLTTGIAPSPLGAGSTGGTTSNAILGFSIATNGTVDVSAIKITIPIDAAVALSTIFTNYSLIESPDNSFSTTAGHAVAVANASISTSGTGAGAFVTLSPAVDLHIDGVTKYYFLVASVSNSVSTSVHVQPSLIASDVTLAPGTLTGGPVTGTNYSFQGSQTSTITLNGGTTTAIDYASYTDAGDNDIDNTTDSENIGTFRLRDVANDPDALATTLTSLEISVTNVQNLDRISLFVGDATSSTEATGTLVDQGSLGTGTVLINFTGLSIAAADNGASNGDQNFTIRASFKTGVTDNEVVQVTITNATTLSTGSGLASFSATTGASANDIEVTATKLIFVDGLNAQFTGPINATPSPQAGSTFNATVAAVDANLNIDLDNTASVSLNITPNATVTFTGGSAVALVSGKRTYTLSINKANSYSLGASDGAGLTDATAGNNNDVDVNIISLGVTIGKANLGACEVSATNIFTPLPLMSLTEADNSDFSTGTNLTFLLILPDGWEFMTPSTSSPTPAYTPPNIGYTASRNITAAVFTGFIGTTIARFTYSVNNTDLADVLSISGLYVKNVNGGSAVDILRSGTGLIQGADDTKSLGTLSTTASPSATFKVEASPNQSPINANETNFSNGSQAIILNGEVPIGNPITAGVFSGASVVNNFIGAPVNAQRYTFNPNTLDPGNYPVTYTYSDPATGCVSSATRNLNVFASAIDGLASQYCVNNTTTQTLSVNPAFMPAGYNFVNFSITFPNYKFMTNVVNLGSSLEITVPNHGLQTGDNVLMYIDGGFIPSGYIYGNYTITRIDANTYRIPVITIGSWFGFGYVFLPPPTVTGVSVAGSLLTITATGHGLQIGAKILHNINGLSTDGGATTFIRGWYTVSSVLDANRYVVNVGASVTGSWIASGTTINIFEYEITSFRPDMAASLNSRFSDANSYYVGFMVRPNPCSGVGCVESVWNNQYVGINPLPIVSFSGLATDYCVNNSVPVGLIGNQPDGNFIASPTFGLTDGPSNTATFLPSTSGIITESPITVTYSYTDFNGCTNSVSRLTTVHDLPVVFAGTDQQICNGSSVIIGGSPTASVAYTVPTPIFSYQWDNAGSLDNATNSNPRANPITNTTYTVTVRDVYGCQNTDNTFVEVFTPATVVPLLNDTICGSNTKVLAITGLIGGSASTATWKTNGTGTFRQNVTTNTTYGQADNYLPSATDVNVLRNFTITLETNDPIGPCPLAIGSLNLIINPAPVAAAGLDQTYCANDAMKLTGTITGSATSVKWTSNGLGKFTDSLSTITQYIPHLSELISGPTITVTMTSNDPDGTGGPCLPSTDNAILNINARATIDAGADFARCFDASNITLTAIKPLGSTASSYTWTGGGGSFIAPNALVSGYTPGPSDLGNIIALTITTDDPDGSGPSGPCLAESDVVLLTLNRDPAAPLVAQPAPICVNGISPSLQTFVGIGFDAKWYSDPLLTPASNFGNSPTVPSGINTATDQVVTFYATQIEQSTGCEGPSSSVTVTVNPNPVAIFTVAKFCFEDFTEFTDASTLIYTNGNSGSINQWAWNFADPTSSVNISTSQNPTHRYTSIGSYNPTLTIMTTDGCSKTIDYLTQNSPNQLRIGPVPITDFNFKKICDQDLTDFFSDAGPANSEAGLTYAWAFGDPTSAFNTSIQENPGHTFTTYGTYTAQLTITTPLGCTDGITKQVPILPYLDSLANFPYIQDFENNPANPSDVTPHGWVAQAVVSAPMHDGLSSWQLNTPNGSIINNAKSGVNAWFTRVDSLNTYFNSERSVLYGPCINVDSLDRPILSFDYWSNTDLGNDGVYLEIALPDASGNINWTKFGDLSTGINWYNRGQILGLTQVGAGINAIGQAVGQIGWTGNTQTAQNPGGWVNARYSLDDFASTKKLMVRFVFGSNPDNPDVATTALDGFALDNFKLSSRNRQVLAENFTNGLGPQAINNAAFENFKKPLNNSEIVKMQYHTSLAGKDPINDENPADPSARATFYGITNASASIPRVYIDGYSEGDFVPNDTWADAYFSKQTLVDAPFSIAVGTDPTTEDGTMIITTSLTALENIPVTKGKLIVHTAVVEKSVDGNQFVLRKMLPSAAGRILTLPLLTDQVVTLDPLTWRVENSAIGSDLSVIVFIQDQVTREIYQTAVDSIPANLPTGLITGTEDDEYAKHIYLYPNPANHEVNIELPAAISKSTPIEMYDAFGRVVYQSAFNAGEKTKTVSTSTFADGIYMLQLITPNGSKVVRKVMVTHR
jgi:Secretion system C-terminal sorting domain/PKD domain